MRRYLLPFFTIFPLFVLSQTATENYVLTKTYKVETTSSISSPTLSQAYQEITYYDGLGRPKQHIAHKMGGNGQDLVTHIEYDALGRQTKDYLPYPRSSSSLNIDLNALSGTESYYNDPDFENTENPYSEKELELSPFNRVLKQAAPGETWALGNGHEIEFDRDANDAGEVYFFTVSNPGSTPTLVYEGNYDANELYKTVTKDENHSSGLNHTVEEFTDKQGRVVLKRGYNDMPHDTYYVYDDYGNLTFVLSPKLSKVIVSGGSLVSGYQTMLANLGYQYKYDHRNRLVWKQLPGKTREYIAYNKQDQPVAVGPVLNPFPGGSGQGWTYTFYDTFGRVAYSVWYGTSVSESSRVNIENNLANFVATPTTSPTNIGGIQVYYTSVMSPTVEVLTANYYDDYRFSWAPSTFPSTVEGQAVSYNNQNLPKGLPTGSWTRILSGANDTNGLVSYTLYDAKARAIRSYSTNHIGGHDMVDTQYNFIGDVVKTLAHHQSSSENLDVEDTFSYTAQGRLDKHKQQFDGCTLVTLSENRYDALGQLESKEVGDGLQTVDYKYNVRGWLTDINDIGTLDDDLFAFKISYEGLSNGNISRTQWKTAMGNPIRRYDYTYDALNRLLDAEYSSDLGTSSYNESLNYDENGNIIGLLRRGLIEDHSLQILMDNLEYTYDINSNQLLSVYDATGNPGGFDDGNTSGDDYDYDVYGNMVEDANKHITNISYNHLNLPKQITITGLSVAAQGTIDYLYTANGIKLRKKVDAVSGIQIDYVGNFYYEDSSLKFVNHAEGYLEESRSGWQYVYQYKDHLGNIRLSYSDLDGNGSIDTGSEILEENNYYPFGMKHKGYNNVINGTDHPYGFAGKEEQNELGLNWIDITARNYDPAIGRWMNLDPLAENGRRWSPYNFAFDNPIYFQDYDGMWPWPAPIKRIGDMIGRAVERKINDVNNSINKGWNSITSTVSGWFRRKGGDVYTSDSMSDGKKSSISDEPDPKAPSEAEMVPIGGLVETANVITPELDKLAEGVKLASDIIETACDDCLSKEGNEKTANNESTLSNNNTEENSETRNIPVFNLVYEDEDGNKIHMKDTLYEGISKGMTKGSQIRDWKKIKIDTSYLETIEVKN